MSAVKMIENVADNMHTSRMVQTMEQLLDTLKHSAFAILSRRGIKETLWSTVHFLYFR